MAPTITTVANSDKSTSLRASSMTLVILRHSFFSSAALSRCRRSTCPVISSFLSGHERVYDMAASCVSVLYTGNTVCVLLSIETVALVGSFTLLRHPIEEEPPTCTTSYRQCRQQLLCPFQDLCRRCWCHWSFYTSRWIRLTSTEPSLLFRRSLSFLPSC